MSAERTRWTSVSEFQRAEDEAAALNLESQ